MTDIEVWVGGSRFVFQPGAEVVLGRGEDATIQFPDPLVGRAHARLSFDPGRESWRIEDLGSRNGTWVDGRSVTDFWIDRPATIHLGGSDTSSAAQVNPLFSPDIASGVSQPPPAGPPTLGLPPPPGGVPAPPPPPQQPGDAQGPPMVVRLEGRTHVFPVGVRVRVGRDPSLELVTENPLVSREQHGVITSDGSGAYYTDTSTRGTYLEGKQVKGMLQILESVTLHLGDPATGEELGITPPLSAETMAVKTRRRETRRKARRFALIAGAAVVVVGGTVAGVVLSRGNSGSSNSASPTLSAATLSRAESATVRLLQGSVDNFIGWGSGTIISPNGLILTNGHVAEPQAPGEAVGLGAPGSSLDANPPYLTVELTKGPSSPAVATYRARPVAVDGYLDLAVVAIYATTSGQPVNPASLNLPYLPIGNVNSVQLDESVTVLGYPGVSNSDSISVTSGVVSTFVPDPLHHVSDTRFELETTARVAHGNSGGAAIDDNGELVGVPSLTIQGQGVDISWRLRSVTEALPLIAAAKSGSSYVSHILVGSSSSEQVLRIGFGTTQRAACRGRRSVPSGSTSAFIGVTYSGFPGGIDGAFVIAPSGGSPISNVNGELPQFVLTASSGCETYDVSAQQFNASQLSGSYQVQLLAGPSLAAVGPVGTVSVAGGSGATGVTGAGGLSGSSGASGQTG